jgi:gliding motility-associated-like protein
MNKNNSILHIFFRKILCLIVLLAIGCIVNAQTEYLVTVNPATGNYTKVDSINGIRWVSAPNFSTIDENHNQFILVGSPPDFSSTYLLSLNQTTGAIINSPSFPPTNRVLNALYSNSLNILYGVQAIAGVFYLVTINVTTGAITQINTLSGLAGLGSGAIALNDNIHEITFVGFGSGGLSIITVDLLTGSILFQPSIVTGMQELQYDNLSNSLYGVYTSGTQHSLVNINITNGIYSIVSNLPSMASIETGSSTYDNNNHQYIFAAAETGANDSLYVVNTSTGNIFSSALVDKESNNPTQGNVVEYRYDNSSGILYALHWEPVTPLGCSVISTGTLSAIVCPNTSYQLLSGKLVSGAGVYQDTIRNISGCDSIRTTINLSFYPGLSIATSNVTICPGAAYQLPSGKSVSNAGVYLDRIISSHGCDSIITTINLAMYPVSVTSVTDSFNQGQSYTLPSGTTVNNSGTYQSVLKDKNGCDSTINTILFERTKPDCVVSPPNAFTPNADGYNDLWIIFQHGCVEQVKVDVYNRWGSLVYHSDNYNNDWNGEYNNKPLPDATYYYVVSPVYADGRQPVLKGNVTILR